MTAARQKRLEALGWRFGTVQEFLGLSDEEAELIETKLDLARLVRERRQAARVSQAAFAKRLGSSQSRVAKIEAADPQVSLDLMVRAAYALGATKADVGRVLVQAPKGKRGRRAA